MEVVADFACETGECPTWHEAEQALYWTDIPAGRMFRFDPKSGLSDQVDQGEPIGALVVQADGSLLQFMTEGKVQRWADGKVAIVCDGLEEERGGRFNDAIADPSGRVFAGTMPVGDRPSKLYRFESGADPMVVLGHLGQSNGMAFDHAYRFLYHTDTIKKTIQKYTYDQVTGNLGESILIAKIKDDRSVPDGLAMDEEGILWSAQWGGARVERFTGSGEMLPATPVPTPLVASVAFGGPGLADVYISTAGGNDRPRNGPQAGALFRFRSSVHGMPRALGRILV